MRVKVAAIFNILLFFLTPAITKTLGLPQVPEDWGNDRVLSFVRFMWLHSKAQEPQSSSRGPAPPSTVAASGKKAFSALSVSDSSKMQYQRVHTAAQVEDSPMIAPDTAILVRSESGKNLQIPAWGDGLEEDDSWSGSDSFDRSSVSESIHSMSRTNAAVTMNPERRNKNLQWLRAHFQSLTEVGNLVFNNADLWQLHQYFFSPAYTITDENESGPLEGSKESDKAGDRGADETEVTPGSPDSSSSVICPGNESALNGLGPPETNRSAESSSSSDVDSAARRNKRGSIEEALKDAEPCAKRAKNLKPRIAYFPRIRVSVR